MRSRTRSRSPLSSCPACGTRAGREAARFRNFPVFLFPMPHHQARQVERRDLILHGCASCGHLYQPRADLALLDVIYKEHYRNYPYDSAEAMQGPYREPFNRMFELMVQSRRLPPTPRLLEIGCSRPENLRPFADQGFTCVGVDPSPLARRKQRDSRISMFSGYYESTALPHRFDVIVSRFNLEHVVHPGRMLAKIRSELAPGGIVVVQVPNVDYYLEKRQPVFVAHEHIQYFSMSSLGRLFARFGFRPAVSYHHHQPSVMACFVQSNEMAESPARSRATEYFTDVRRKRMELKTHLAKPERVVLYGCGLAVYSVLAMLSKRELGEIVVVDDNARYDGAFIPSYGIPVRRPDPKRLAGRDIVILTLNPLYHDKVLAGLKATGRRLKVVCLGEQGILRVLRMPGRKPKGMRHPARRRSG